MKPLIILALAFWAVSHPMAQVKTLSQPCEELAQKAEQTFKKMDDALKLKAGMLLGEMETAKSALQGCIDWNKSQSTQMAMVWVLGDAGLVAVAVLLVFHQRRMHRAVQMLSSILKAKDPEHPVKHVPAPWLYWGTLGILGMIFLGLNFVALFL